MESAGPEADEFLHHRLHRLWMSNIPLNGSFRKMVMKTILHSWMMMVKSVQGLIIGTVMLSSGTDWITSLLLIQVRLSLIICFTGMAGWVNYSIIVRIHQLNRYHRSSAIFWKHLIL